MVEFFNLKLIWIQLQICFSEGTNFNHLNYPFSVSLQCCCYTMESHWRRGCAAATADVGCCCAQQSGEYLKGLIDDVGRHWRRDLPGLLVSNGENFRNLQVERDQPQGHYPDVSIRSSEGFQAEEGR